MYLSPLSVENSLDDHQCAAKAASAAALRHTGPVRAAAREASFADAAEGAAGVDAPLALAQQPALVQLSALIYVCRGDRCGLGLSPTVAPPNPC